MRRITALAVLTMLLSGTVTNTAEPEKTLSARDALKPFNLLIGKWNASGVPEGTPDDRQKGHWTETIDWGWKFKGEEAWLIATFEKGKYFTRGELRHIPKDNTYQFKAETPEKQMLIYQGAFKNHELLLERIDEKTKETHRLVFALLHSNRINYRAEVKPADRTFYTKLYRVGATKDGEPLVASVVSERECVVSGGTGTTTVTYKGKTYYVCCSGCRDAFNEDPAKFVAEFEAKRAKQK